MESQSGAALKSAGFIAAAALVATNTFAQGPCNEAGQFASFFRRFSDDATFQKSRVPESVRYGAWRADHGKRVLKWQEMSPEQLVTSPSGRIIPTTADQSKLFVVKTSPAQNGRVHVHVVRDESDSFDSTFSFRVVNGCWMLEEIRDDYFDDEGL